MAGVQDKPSKLISKQLRSKANEFLASRKNSSNLVDILNHFESGANQSACLLTLELIFTELLKRGEMYQEIVPLKPLEEQNHEVQYRMWLREIYDETFHKMLQCMECAKPNAQMQAFITAMKLIAWEGKYPLEPKSNEYYFPVYRLKLVIMKLLSSERNNTHLLQKFQEYSAYPDVLYYSWKLLPPITPKTHPHETFIMNYLNLVDKLPLPTQKTMDFNPDVVLCRTDDNCNFKFDEISVRRSLNKAWSCVMHWDHTPATYKQLLIVLLERILHHLDKPLLLTDFLMDSLDMGGPVSLLALQGVFTMIQVHNLDYPNIFTKLYSMFEPEIFHTKFKARLFYLSDLFLSSTHLPESLVAAFAKRLARLALVAPYEDVIIICMFIGNLILRHPGLKCLINHPTGGSASSDPYIMEERDPMKSNAMSSSLWEIQTLQNHILANVATAARFINDPLPSVEWDLSKVLDNTSNDIFDKELKKRGKEIALTFDRPLGMALAKGEKVMQYWQLF